jgi:hypothetical protein
MASVTLKRVWINLVDTGDAVVAASSDRMRERGIKGEKRQYAGGRYRSVYEIGKTGSFSFVLRDVSDADVETLDTWLGQLVQLRDHRGKKLFGWFTSMSIKERKTDNYNDVSIAIDELTYNEAV